MKMYHLIIGATPTLDTFSPVELVNVLAAKCKKEGKELAIDVYTTEVK